ncbi:hypothetical protein [Geminicoccus harenae]|uniref:hypothetical protein n=1 Tax=Geminicoccus harenae TaxID=2498453 RepID=UPI00168BC2E6|nr:hypothetical protein [Geminicoccus harenae]
MFSLIFFLRQCPLAPEVGSHLHAESCTLLGHLKDTLALLMWRRTALIRPGWLGLRSQAEPGPHPTP